MTRSLPNWIERLLGVDAASGEGTVWRLSSTWSWAPWATLLLIVAAVAFVVFVYSREGGEAKRAMRVVMGGLRLAAVAILLFMIAEFVLSLERTGLPYVAVVVDQSGSMNVVDRYDDERLRETLAQRVRRWQPDESVTRLNLAKSILLDDRAALLRGIERDYKLRVYRLAETAQPIDGELDDVLDSIEALEPLGNATRLGDGVRSVLNELRGSPPAAVILLTDGITTEGPSLSEVASYARRKGVPLFTIGIGSDEPVRDLEVDDLLVDDVVFVDDIVNFEFKLHATGFAGREVEVALRQRGDSAPLVRRKLTIADDQETQTVRLPYRPKEVGDFEYEVAVEPLPEEVSADNNRQRRLVSVRKEQIRVLLVQAYPNYEFRYLKHLLERDNTVILHTVLQEADPEYAAQDKSALTTIPVRRDQLFEYDVVIFGDVNPGFLSASVMQNLVEFVTVKGGGLVFIAGPRFTPVAYRDTPLAPLMPVDLRSVSTAAVGESLSESFVMQPSELGLTSPQMQLGDSFEESARIWRSLPGLYWLFESPGLRPAARVLAEHPTQLDAQGRPLPVIAMQFVGAGKVLFHATDETWRWRYRVGDVFFARYWVQTVRYLSRTKLLGKDRSAELTTDRRRYERGETVRFRVRFLDERNAPAIDDGVTVLVEREGHEKQRLSLHRHATHRGIFEGVFGKAVEGSYHVSMAEPAVEGQSPSADFLVVAPPGELARIQMDTRELEQAAELTKGVFYRAERASRVLRDLPSGRQVPIEALPPISLWNRWPLLLVFVGVLFTEWVLRKRKGLL